MRYLLTVASFCVIAGVASACCAKTWTRFDGATLEGDVVGFSASTFTVGRYAGVVFVDLTKYQRLTPERKHVVDSLVVDAGYKSVRDAALAGKGRPVPIMDPLIRVRTTDGKTHTFSLYLLDRADIESLIPAYRQWYARMVAEQQRSEAIEKERKEAREAEAEAAAIRCPICDKITDPMSKYRTIDGRHMRLYTCPSGHEFLVKAPPGT
jgi:hypothetical protein